MFSWRWALILLSVVRMLPVIWQWVVTAAGMAQQYGSMRMAKAGYQILADRYPGLMQSTKEGPKSLKDKNTFQLAQLCRATGEEERAVALEGKVDMKEMGEGGKIALIINKMARLTKEKENLLGEIARLEKKLSNEGFVAKAPAAVIEGEKAKLQKYLEVRESLTIALAKLK